MLTPKAVETAEERREKLVFRAKLQVDRELLAKYHRHKIGVSGLGFVRTSPQAKWPGIPLP